MENVRERLKKCYDPEIPVNIVDLGLVYDISILTDSIVSIKMTLTTPGCPAEAYLNQQVKEEVEKLPGVKEALVEIVWDPPWKPERMSEEARKQLASLEGQQVTVDFDPSTYMPKKKGHLVKSPDGTIVLINMGNRRFKVNEDIAGLWEGSDGTKTVDEITELVAMELQLSPLQLRAQVIELYKALISNGLLEPESTKDDAELPLSP